jgi:hypothetical protein
MLSYLWETLCYSQHMWMPIYIMTSSQEDHLNGHTLFVQQDPYRLVVLQETEHNRNCNIWVWVLAGSQNSHRTDHMIHPDGPSMFWDTNTWSIFPIWWQQVSGWRLNKRPHSKLRKRHVALSVIPQSARSCGSRNDEIWMDTRTQLIYSANIGATNRLATNYVLYFSCQIMPLMMQSMNNDHKWHQGVRILFQWCQPHGYDS